MTDITVSVINRHAQAATAAYRWARQYDHYLDGRTPWVSSRQHPRETLQQLEALGPSPVPEDVDHIIGNRSWTQPMCDVCNRCQPLLVSIAGDGGTNTVCRECVAVMSAAFGGDTK